MHNNIGPMNNSMDSITGGGGKQKNGNGGNGKNNNRSVSWSANNDICSPDMTFDDCELAYLRNAVDYVHNENKIKKATMPQINRMLIIVEIGRAHV